MRDNPSRLNAIRHPHRCTNLAFPGPLLVIDHVTDCWVASYRDGDDHLFLVGRNPNDRNQRTLIYTVADGQQDIVGVPGHDPATRLASVRPPRAVIDYLDGERPRTFDEITGRWS
jgi:hypothetical protein